MPMHNVILYAFISLISILLKEMIIIPPKTANIIIKKLHMFSMLISTKSEGIP